MFTQDSKRWKLWEKPDSPTLYHPLLRHMLDVSSPRPGWRRTGGVGQVVEKELASGLGEGAIDYPVAMQPPLASCYWPEPANRPGGAA